MKQIIGSLGMIALAMLLAGVSFHGPVKDAPVTPVKKFKPSYGYTIIEYGIGIDCNGDTVRITRANGAQVAKKNSERLPKLGDGAEDQTMAMRGW